MVNVDVCFRPWFQAQLALCSVSYSMALSPLVYFLQRIGGEGSIMVPTYVDLTSFLSFDPQFPGLLCTWRQELLGVSAGSVLSSCQ